MARSKNHKEDEDLKGELRAVIKENKALRKRLRSLEKSKHIWQQYNLTADEMHNTVEKMKDEVKCQSCGVGVLLVTDLGIRTLHTCSTCLYRKIVLK